MLLYTHHIFRKLYMFSEICVNNWFYYQTLFKQDSNVLRTFWIFLTLYEYLLTYRYIHVCICNTVIFISSQLRINHCFENLAWRRASVSFIICYLIIMRIATRALYNLMLESRHSVIIRKIYPNKELLPFNFRTEIYVFFVFPT